jgi:hypothetical protein
MFYNLGAYMNYILKRNFNPKTYAFTDIQLERFDDEQLNSFKSETENTAIIIYETTNINDEQLHKLLNEYEITKIVWKRHNTPYYNNQRKIEVAFIPEQIDKMNEEAEQIIQQINLEEEQLYVYNKELEKLRIMESRARNLPPLDKLIEEMTQKKEEMNKIITSDMTEIEALLKWAETDFKIPAGDRITKIKESYAESWSNFLIYAKELFASINEFYHYIYKDEKYKFDGITKKPNINELVNSKEWKHTFLRIYPQEDISKVNFDINKITVYKFNVENKQK